MSRARITARTGERLVRLAFELEELANRLKEEGFQEQADVRRCSSTIGDVGRQLLDTLQSRAHADEYKRILQTAPPRGQHDS